MAGRPPTHTERASAVMRNSSLAPVLYESYYDQQRADASHGGFQSDDSMVSTASECLTAQRLPVPQLSVADHSMLIATTQFNLYGQTASGH